MAPKVIDNFTIVEDFLLVVVVWFFFINENFKLGREEELVKVH